MKSNCAGDSLLMLLTGFAVGAAVTLLLAPQSGKRTRRELRRKAEDAQDYLEEIGEDLIAKGRELVERGREAADSTVKDLTEKVKEATS